MTGFWIKCVPVIRARRAWRMAKRSATVKAAIIVAAVASPAALACTVFSIDPFKTLEGNDVRPVVHRHAVTPAPLFNGLEPRGGWPSPFSPDTGGTTVPIRDYDTVKVPEPTALFILGGGVFALGVVHRLRKTG